MGCEEKIADDIIRTRKRRQYLPHAHKHTQRQRSLMVFASLCLRVSSEIKHNRICVFNYRIEMHLNGTRSIANFRITLLDTHSERDYSLLTHLVLHAVAIGSSAQTRTLTKRIERGGGGQMERRKRAEPEDSFNSQVI